MRKRLRRLSEYPLAHYWAWRLNRQANLWKRAGLPDEYNQRVGALLKEHSA